jgi:hypothetical protein
MRVRGGARSQSYQLPRRWSNNAASDEDADASMADTEALVRIFSFLKHVPCAFLRHLMALEASLC